MKTQGWKFLGIIGVSFLMNVAEAKDIKTVWLAKLSGQTQCATSMPPSLSSAVDRLEQVADTPVLEAKFATLSDQMFPAVCGRPKNLFHVAKIGAVQEAIEVAEQEGWIQVDPQTITSPSLPDLVENPEAQKYELLPVVVAK